jgi:glycerol-3-phosphate dehydrogenase
MPSEFVRPRRQFGSVLRVLTHFPNLSFPRLPNSVFLTLLRALASHPEMTILSRRPNLDGRHFHVVILGGGINGAAIARECSRAGKSVLVVEQHDFASGTTSRATRIIHGGLRYLEHGEIWLVRESLQERQRLLTERPHLVRPLNFLLAMPPESRRSALEVRFGLWLYRRFANRFPLHDSKEDIRRLEQILDRGQHWSVFAFEDAQCEYPERLVIEWLVEAAGSGAVVRNYTEALAIERINGVAKGVRLRDCVTGDEYRVHADWTFNATGPWADHICGRSGISTGEPLIGGVRGSHILLPPLANGPDAAVFTEAVDGRPIFVIPWAGQLLVGTTEVRDNGDPAKATPSTDEIAYLLRSFQRLFPSAGYDVTHIRAAFAGIRPLPYITERSPSSITRRHFLVDHSDDGSCHMISIIGGKLTTAASLARECARAIGLTVPEPLGFALIPALPDPPDSLNAVFGPAAQNIRRLLAADPALREPLCEHTSHLVAEAVHSAYQEFAVTLADILLRRVPVALEPCWREECTRVAAARIGHALGWTPTQIAMETERFQAEYRHFLQKPTG